MDFAVAFADSFAWREINVNDQRQPVTLRTYGGVPCRLEHVGSSSRHVCHLVLKTLEDVSANLVSLDGSRDSSCDIPSFSRGFSHLLIQVHPLSRICSRDCPTRSAFCDSRPLISRLLFLRNSSPRYKRLRWLDGRCRFRYWRAIRAGNCYAVSSILLSAGYTHSARQTVRLSSELLPISMR